MINTSPEKNTDELQYQRGYLLFFCTGEMHFGAKASSITNITDKNWTPPEGSKRFELSDLLGMSPTQGTRTLVVNTSGTSCGFVVDSIFTEGISTYTIEPASPLLRAWMYPPVVTGFCAIDNQLFGVLDLIGLAEFAITLHDNRTSKP